MTRYFPLFLILLLLGSVAVSPAAFAASASPVAPTFPQLSPPGGSHTEEAEESEAEEEEFEECEAAAEEEFEFGEEEPEESAEEEAEFEAEECGEESEKAAPKGAPFVTAPFACQVRRAESTIATLPGSDQVRLTVRYRTYSPTPVTVGLKLKDSRGTVSIEHTTKHMGENGVLHITTKLGTAVMERAMKASEFDVSLRAPETPGFCAGDLEQRLHIAKHAGARAARVYSD
jgi:hypothetical protein